MPMGLSDNFSAAPSWSTTKSKGSSTSSVSDGLVNLTTPSKSIIRIKPHSSASTSKLERKQRRQNGSSSQRPSTASNRARSRSRNRSGTSSTHSSQSDHYDRYFQQQHEQSMARQQFRTNTSSSRVPGTASTGSKSMGTPQRRHVSKRSASSAQPRPYHVTSSDSAESGSQISSLSRRSEPFGSGEHHHGIMENRRAPEGKLGSVKRCIEELSKAIGHERRIAAITNACAEFDHWDTEKHNAELHLGSANVLSLVLSMTDDDDEIRMICAALEMVYRASTDVVKTSFEEVGSEVVPLLLRLLERCENGTVKHADVSILNITKVLLYYSRVSELRVALARHQGLLNALTRVATSILNPDCRVLRMRVLANLSNSDDNKVMMLEHTGLMDSILKIAALDLSENAREYAAASLMDLASSQHTQIIMARNDKLLGTLVKLTVMDEMAETREYAVTAMQNLAFSKENRIRLVSYSSGVILEALKKALSIDIVDKTRRRAAGALTNLACDETADFMAAHHGLIDTLSRISTQDKNDDVQKRACLALTKIASSCDSEMDTFDTILDGLVNAATSPNSSGIPAVLRVKARDVSTRETMARHPGLLETLADMSTSEAYTSKDRDNAMRAIMHLTNENRNRKSMCNKLILNALVAASSLEGEENLETRDSAVVAIERLATEVSNRQYMARHKGLIVAIAKATERESRSELAGEENTQPRLAKPLLMSLLLAM